MNQQMTASGIGVGLSVCKFITERYGGIIKVYSRPKYGSLFQSSFTLIQQDYDKCLSNIKDSTFYKKIKINHGGFSINQMQLNSFTQQTLPKMHPGS